MGGTLEGGKDLLVIDQRSYKVVAKVMPETRGAIRVMITNEVVGPEFSPN